MTGTSMSIMAGTTTHLWRSTVTVTVFTVLTFAILPLIVDGSTTTGTTGTTTTLKAQHIHDPHYHLQHEYQQYQDQERQDHSPIEHNGKPERPRAKPANEMLVPRYSTTALMCEPIFMGSAGTAQWFHDGIVVANVTSTSNAILHNRIYRSEQPVPDVGFLIITNISLGDEGEYWCRRDDTAQSGDVVRIVIAYVDQFRADSRPQFRPSRPSLGQRVTAECPRTRAVPSPTTTWTLNGTPLDLASTRVDVSANGTLTIARFSAQDIGLYECALSNFAGRTTAKIFVDAKRLNDGRFEQIHDISLFTRNCQNVFHNGVLWFLIGCLATSCAVLLYLLCAMLLLRPNVRNRTPLRPAHFLRSHPSLAPGFRKVIAPTPDLYRGAARPSLNIQQQQLV